MSAGAPRTHVLTFASELAAPAAVVWQQIACMAGVNEELGPWLRMTSPSAAAGLRLEDAPTGQPLFPSWVLLGGVLPIDRHFFVLNHVEPGRSFVEDSTSWTERRWEHRRQVEPRGERACVVTDRLTFTPRVGVSGPVLRAVIGAVFRHRHRRLQARFGEAVPKR